MFLRARALVYATIFVAFGLVFIPSRILARAGVVGPRGIGVVEAAAIVLVLAGGVLVLASIAAFVFVGKGTAAPFDPPRRLVTSGPFRYVRNPIYIGALAGLAGAAVYYRSVALVVYGGALALALHLLVRLYEEPVLRQSFGDAYDRYRTRVPRWIPALRGGDHARDDDTGSRD
jgi:protein-S-isoprenylcysteine O-methyltransferase Ste14